MGQRRTLLGGIGALDTSKGGNNNVFLHKHIPNNTGHPESPPDRLLCLPRQVRRLPDPSEPLLVPSRMP